jgi:hypothetical protein
MTIKYTNICHSKALQYLPKLGSLVLEYNIWQPWFQPETRSDIFSAIGTKRLTVLSYSPHTDPPLLTHRNLSTRTSMYALVQQTFLAKNPCKKSADLHPRQGNLLQRNILQGSMKPLFTKQNSLETSWKNALFQHASFSTKISMFQPDKEVWNHQLRV